VNERRREVEPALHAAGVALDPPVRGVFELDQGQQLLRPPLGLIRAQPEQPPVQDEQLAACLAGVEAGLLERDADPAAGFVGVAGDVDARHLRPAGGDRQQRRQHPHGGRLARPVGAEEAEDLAAGDLQVDAADGLDRALATAVVLDQALGANRRGPVVVHLAPARRLDRPRLRPRGRAELIADRRRS